ncbi:MAG TPA: flavodoxin domain-containing protein [Flavitalea sp.]|nr:flavodoxin domain-containing protein [Flavitalea sp.]
MLSGSKLKMIEDLVAGSTKEELVWINGYLSGVIAGHEKEQVLTATTGQKITIAYGTETGNSKKLALNFATSAKKNGIHAKLVSLDQYRINDLSKEEYFFTIISTQGEGEPPAAAKKFYDHIHQNGFKVSKLKYGVLALGDTSYPLFCKAGEDVDSQLQKLGGERLLSLQKCDIDYESDAEGWFSEVLAKINGKGNGLSTIKPRAPKKTGKKIYTGSVLKNIILNDRGSEKETHHLEIAAENVSYEPGDSIGIIPSNPAEVVQAVISLSGIPSGKLFLFRNQEYTLHELLSSKVNIQYLPERVVKQYAIIVQQEIPETKISLYDLLRIYPGTVSAVESFIPLLEPITPRLYSISSSPQAHTDEIHLTVARDFFSLNEEIQCGLCSGYLSLLKDGDTIDFYIHPNDAFRLPSHTDDVIMIGPGTGIAPFRSFLAERDALGAAGRNWLFFGDRNFVTDFLYQSEIQNWMQTGVLTAVDVAFSRDGTEKIYVQHKMRKKARQLYEWIENGAYVYICGAKEPMSVDVENTLLYIIAEEGNKSADESMLFLAEMKERGKYLKDVY